LRAFNEANVVKQFSGRSPIRRRSIQRRIRQLRDFAQRKWIDTGFRAVMMVIFGIVVPGALLATIVAYKGWLFAPENQPILVGAEPAIEQLEPRQLGIFLADQTLKGAANDIAEVFEIDVGDVANNPRNIVFSTLVVVYRLVSGGVAIAIIYLLYRLIGSARKVNDAIAELEQSLASS
jgi:hypothetical protein